MIRPEWKTSTVMALANQIVDSGQIEYAPVLADAFQDAGCDEEISSLLRNDKTACFRCGAMGSSFSYKTVSGDPLFPCMDCLGKKFLDYATNPWHVIYELTDRSDGEKILAEITENLARELLRRYDQFVRIYREPIHKLAFAIDFKMYERSGSRPITVYNTLTMSEPVYGGFVRGIVWDYIMALHRNVAYNIRSEFTSHCTRIKA